MPARGQLPPPPSPPPHPPVAPLFVALAHDRFTRLISVAMANSILFLLMIVGCHCLWQRYLRPPRTRTRAASTRGVRTGARGRKQRYMQHAEAAHFDEEGVEDASGGEGEDEIAVHDEVEDEIRDANGRYGLEENLHDIDGEQVDVATPGTPSRSANGSVPLSKEGVGRQLRDGRRTSEDLDDEDGDDLQEQNTRRFISVLAYPLDH